MADRYNASIGIFFLVLYHFQAYADSSVSLINNVNVNVNNNTSSNVQSRKSYKPDPDYGELIKAQRSCDPKPWSSLTWRNPNDAKIDPRTGWLILSNVKVTHGGQKVTPPWETETEFTVAFRYYHKFFCGTRYKIPDNSYEPGPGIEKISISTALEGNPGTDKPGTHILLASELSSTFTWILTESDLEAPQGLRCFSLFEDFLKNPNIIDVERMCEGKSEKEKADLRADIATAVEYWRNRTYNECKKKIPFLTAMPSKKTPAFIDGPANIRGTPSGNGKITGELPEDTSVQVLEKRGSWFRINANSLIGWTSSKNLRVRSSSSCKTWQ